MLPRGIGRLDAEITIRRAESIADYRACQEAQRQAWGISEEDYVIPIATMVGANLHGGMVIGAFRSGGQALGMSFGFLGRVGERICLYSQLTGVVPAYQSRGVGHALKLVQRYLARAEGLDLIAWAFDPLQAGNAHFNLDRLGAAAGRYIDNMYGERTDALNAGVPTDRLIAEWDLETSPGPRALPDPDVIASLPRLIRTGRDQRCGLEPLGVESRWEGPLALLEIPARIAELRQDRPDLAEAWRKAVREAFPAAFALGARAVGFVREESSGERRYFYLLERPEA